MTELDQKTIAYLQNLAKASPGKEICGAVLNDLTVVQITNVSAAPDHFVFEKSDWFRLLNSKACISYLYHSHLTGCPNPSEPDLESQKKHKYPLIIVTPDAWRVVPYES